jgi:predicted DCC family thiol-disulfide oxidoreductase YuxK
MRDRSILFYDGDCGLCCGVVRFVRKRDHADHFAFAPIGDETWTDRIGASGNDDPNTIHLLTATHHFKRSAAVVRLLCTLGGIWPTIGVILWLIPLPIRDLGYRVVAAVRYRIFGRADACPLDEKRDRSCMLP